MGVGDIIAPIADFAGNMATSAFNISQQRSNNRFQRNMANTSHQREVEDLKKAGLNPILSANHGAATPPTQAPHADNPRIGETLNNSARVALEKQQLQQQGALQQAQIREINASADVKESEAHVLKRTTNERIDTVREGLYKFRNEIDHLVKIYPDLEKEIKQKIANLETEGKLKGSEAQHSAYGLDKSRSESRFYQGVGGDVEHWLKLLGIQMPTVNLFKGGKRGSSMGGGKDNRFNADPSKKGYNSHKGKQAQKKIFPESKRKAGDPLELKPEFRKGGK